MESDYSYFSKRIRLTHDFEIFWREDRPREDYNTDHGWKCFLSRCAGKCAETVHKRVDCDYKVITMTGADGKRRSYLSHRLVWLLYYKEWPEDQIDHIDGDGLNNDINNLRVVNTSENARNRKRISTNTSGISGVFFEKTKNKWRVRLMCKNGKRISFGSFLNKEDAIAMRNKIILEHGYTDRHGRE